jgi:23S rRNA pseudouridine1911/1915/1917 synthase
MTNKEDFNVSEEEAGNRLDKILTTRFENLSRSYFQQLIEDNNILLNDKPTKKNVKPNPGDHIDIEFIFTSETNIEPENIPLEILYEDEHMIAINKPTGMVVHPAPGHYTGTVVNALLYHCQQLQDHPDSIRPGIVHRLDQGTSGVLIAAKTVEAQHLISKQFAERTVFKKYIGICLGNPGKRTITTLIARHNIHRKKMCVHSTKGRLAKTICSPIAYNEELSIIECIIETGRTHQIRVHMQHIGFPILGDEIYGSDSANKRHKTTHQMLHAEQLQIIHPITKEKIDFKAPIPADMQKIMNKIR